ncbi:MAG: hypothetical protein ABSB49_01400 [Polyangia bacterium]
MRRDIAPGIKRRFSPGREPGWERVVDERTVAQVPLSRLPSDSVQQVTRQPE